MILSATFSNPTSKCEKILGKAYTKIRVWKNATSGLMATQGYEAEYFTKTQSFRKKFTDEEFSIFLKENAGTTFKSVVQQTENGEIVLLSNRHGEIKELRHPKKTLPQISRRGDRKKNHILNEGVPVPFLIKLGVMTKEGKVVAQKYDKFRQINRFLEFISDIVPDLKRLAEKENGTDSSTTFTKERPLRIADFGCGKSYLTFAVYHYLTEIEKLDVEITGLDLKADVIKKCSDFAQELGYTGLHFFVGDVAKFSSTDRPDMVVTLHACDTATDYALDFAVKSNAKVILSVPCCQHEINLQMEKNGTLENGNPFASLSRYGIIRERMAALATDSLRGELLEQQGYSVQILEFIDMVHTPKNLLIRAVKKSGENEKQKFLSKERAENLLRELGVEQTLANLLGKSPEAQDK